MNSLDTTNSFKSRAIKVKFVSLMVLVTLTGCVSSGQEFGSVSSTSENWYSFWPSSSENNEYTLPRSRSELSSKNELETIIDQSMQLAGQKRYSEARYLLNTVRSNQKVGSQGYKSVTCSMALLAIKEGDISGFRRYARQLDRALGEQISVDPAYVEVVSLYRILENKNLPVNAPDGMTRLKTKFPTS